MKSSNLFNICLLLILAAVNLPAFAHDDPEVEKRKSYTKSYDVNSSDKISVTNQFGEVKVNIWSRNEAKVEVTIIAASTTEERAQALLDLISIEDGKNNSGVFFKTNRKNDNKSSDRERENYKNEKTQINYQVYMPASNPLNLSNQFGPTIIPDFNGALDLQSKFGSLTAGSLTNVKKLSVEFGSASIESVKGDELNIKFSRAIINKMDGSINASFQHCSGIKLGIENSARDLTIKNNFSTLYLDVDKNLSANFLINTHFGEFSNNTSFNVKEESTNNTRGPVFNHNYSGKSGNGTSNIKVKSDFGNVVLGHNLTMDLKEEKKDKTTTKI